MEIIYLKGDATSPSGDDNKIIAHVCNDIGGWGKGFVMAISKKWKEPEKEYRNWYKSSENFELGEIQIVKVQNSLWVCNIIGQRDIRKKDGVAPIRYEAIEDGLEKLSLEAIKLSASVHMPRIGCGLAGGKWEEIEPIIEKTLTSKNVKTVVYDFA